MSRWVLATVAAVCAFTVAATGCGHKIDEKAWRSADEAILGQPIADWPKYKSVVLDICDDDETQFGMDIAVQLDNATSADMTKALLRSDIKYACPKRSDDLEKTFRFLADPCAGKSEQDRRDLEAAGVSCGKATP